MSRRLLRAVKGQGGLTMPWTAPLRAMSLLQKPANPKDLHAQLELKAKRRADVK